MFEAPLWEYHLDYIKYKKLFKKTFLWKLISLQLLVRLKPWFGLFIDNKYVSSFESAPVSCLKLCLT